MTGRPRAAGWLCPRCGDGFRTSTQLRVHRRTCVARRCRDLRWPTEPVARYLLATYGSASAQLVQTVTGVPASTWHKAVTFGLADDAADQIATVLGARHEQFWPGWRSALEPTDADREWLDAWTREGAR